MKKTYVRDKSAARSPPMLFWEADMNVQRFRVCPSELPQGRVASLAGGIILVVCRRKKKRADDTAAVGVGNAPLLRPTLAGVLADKQ